MKFLHLNLVRGKEAQDLLMQTARERRAIYEGDKWSLKEEMTCGAP